MGGSESSSRVGNELGRGRRDGINPGRIFHEGMSTWDCPVGFDKEKNQEKPSGAGAERSRD